jgi:hypothetical protein
MANVAPRAPAAPKAALDVEGLDRGVGFLGLLWASEGSIIGSGWLFGALVAATYAGPSALIGWIVASLIVIVIVLALVHAELGGRRTWAESIASQTRSIGLPWREAETACDSERSGRFGAGFPTCGRGIWSGVRAGREA